MPMIQSNGAKLNAQIEGPERAPVLMLCNSLGTDLHMWDDQAPALTRHFRLLRYDRRGHGKSEAPKGPYNMEMLGRDALAVMDGMGVQKVNWCGLSMGGMVGMWLGANAPQRLDRVVLSNTARLKQMVLDTPVEGYIGCGEAVRDMDHRETIRNITAPTMIIAGRHDPGTTVEAAEFLRDRIPGSKLVVLEAAHIANVEQAQAYTDALLLFFGVK